MMGECRGWQRVERMRTFLAIGCGRGRGRMMKNRQWYDKVENSYVVFMVLYNSK